MADLSMYAGNIGDTLQFIVQSAPPTAEGSATVYNLSGAVVTWLAEDGIARPLTIASAASGVVTYTTSAGDFPSPLTQRGQLRVSAGTGRFYSSYFTVQIYANFGG